MAEAAEAQPKKGGKMGLIIGAVLALVLGGAGFFLVYAGIVPTPDKAPAEHADAAADGHGEKGGGDGKGEDMSAPSPAEFVMLEPIVVSVGAGAELRQLQFVGHLEVEAGGGAIIERLAPRVRDVMNTYLRAVSPNDVEDPAALLRMRAQMLRRVQVVTGEGVVRDLLVSEFILR